MWTQVSQSLHDSMARVISRIATLLPGILALILAVLLFAAIVVFACAGIVLGVERNAAGSNIHNFADALWWAIVTVTTNDGQQFRHFTKYPPGTVENPMSQDEVANKARDLIGPVLGGQKTEMLIKTILQLETLKDKAAVSKALKDSFAYLPFTSETIERLRHPLSP